MRATTEDTAERLYRMGASEVQIVPEVGLLDDEIEALQQYPLPKGQPVRFISMGRLLHWKGFHLSVRAFAAANLPDAEYWIAGDGPERDRLQRLAQECGVGQQIKFFGRLSREETLEKLGTCHVLVHPSLHDSGGWVCIEAMSAGRPVICLDLGGPAVQVTDKTGFKVAAHDPDQVVQDMAVAMARLAQDPDLRAQMGIAGRQLVKENYGWSVVGERLNTVYHKTADCVEPVAFNV